MKNEEELLQELEEECPEMVGSYYGRAQLGQFLMRKQEQEFVVAGEANRVIDQLNTALLSREATIHKLETAVGYVASCTEDPNTSDLGGPTVRVSLPRRVVDFIKKVELKVTAADVERRLTEDENYTPLSDYYQRPLVDVPAIAQAVWDQKGGREQQASNKDLKETMKMMNQMQQPGSPVRAASMAMADAQSHMSRETLLKQVGIDLHQNVPPKHPGTVKPGDFLKAHGLLPDEKES